MHSNSAIYVIGVSNKGLKKLNSETWLQKKVWINKVHTVVTQRSGKVKYSLVLYRQHDSYFFKYLKNYEEEYTYSVFTKVN